MGFQNLDIIPEYSTLADDVVKNFYLPVLQEAILYQRAVGFFSSTALEEITKGIMGLVKNGGHIQLIASPRLSQEDLDAINDGTQKKEIVLKECLLRDLTEARGKYSEDRLNLLSNLIATGILEIKIAFLEKDNEVGMFHIKLGLMQDDDGNEIAFTGSMNESANAYYTNYEDIDVFRSWSSEEDKKRVQAKKNKFITLWNGQENHIQVLKMPDIEQEILKKYLRRPIKNIKSVIQEFVNDDGKLTLNVEEKPHPVVPDSVELRDYQKTAINTWREKGYKGIFDMATGTGKTYTALAAVADLYEHNSNRLGIIIVCPYQHLVEQWVSDIKMFGMKPIVCYSAKKWEERLKIAINSFKYKVTDNFCCITTNATFSLDKFQTIITKLDKDCLIVVDEAHNFGTDNLANKLPEKYPFRLALSATVERYGDEIGTQLIYSYFGERCITYTLKDAIDNDMLTHYLYYPVVVAMNEDELNGYLEITKQIVNATAKCKKVGKRIILSDHAKSLILRRTRMVSATRNKIELLRELIEPYKDSNHMLVYCGATTLNDVEYKEGEPPIEEIRQIDLVAHMLGNDLGMKISKFTSEEDAEEREQLKRSFDEGKYMQALVAIRCLDEGVNIPSIDKAFILASSTNPKEYIQRRGRVLRKFPGKNKSIIYDFITLPVNCDDVALHPESVIKACKTQVQKEINRIVDFAAIADNPAESDELIWNLRTAYDIKVEDEEDSYGDYY